MADNSSCNASLRRDGDSVPIEAATRSVFGGLAGNAPTPNLRYNFKRSKQRRTLISSGI